MLHALALGADWVWLADDDGRAADEDVLATLVELAQRRGLAAVSPMVVDADDPDRLAFTVRRGLTWHRSRAALAATPSTAPTASCCPGSPRCSTGRCSGRRALDAIGVPDLRLFVRGDEVEMHRRLVRSGLPFGTALRAAYLHPAGLDEDKPMLGGRLHARDPDDETKRYYTYRNRGYLVSQPGHAAHRAAGATPVRLVLPGHQAQPPGVRGVAAAGAPGPRRAVPPALIYCSCRSAFAWIASCTYCARPGSLVVVGLREPRVGQVHVREPAVHRVPEPRRTTGRSAPGGPRRRPSPPSQSAGVPARLSATNRAVTSSPSAAIRRQSSLL